MAGSEISKTLSDFPAGQGWAPMFNLPFHNPARFFAVGFWSLDSKNPLSPFGRRVGHEE